MRNLLIVLSLCLFASTALASERIKWDDMSIAQQVSYIMGYGDGLTFSCFEQTKDFDACLKKHAVRSAELTQKVMNITKAVYSSPQHWHIPLRVSMRFIMAFARSEISQKDLEEILNSLAKETKNP